MLKLSNITKQFGDKQILKSVNVTISGRQRIGLIGENGVGKSTLFNLIMEETSPDNGSVQNDQEVIGYLPQVVTPPEDISVLEYLEVELYKIDIALAEVGLYEIDRNQLVRNLSGGQKTKLYLAKLLLQDPRPTILLLDEPTNNLDLDGIEWLQSFIASFEGAILLISHDRHLLDSSVDTIMELSDGLIKIYGGNFSFYREQKEREEEAYKRNYIAQEKKIQRLKEDINTIKTRSKEGEAIFSSRAPGVRRKIRKMAQLAVSRQTKLQKLLESEQHLDKPDQEHTHYVDIKGAIHGDKVVISCRDIAKSFGEKKVLDSVSFLITGTQHVWLKGSNGSGKTVLLKIINGLMQPDKGIIEWGTGINAGYFSQERNDLNLENTIVDELTAIGLTQTEAYKLAIMYYFHPTELTTKIKHLSSGQQTKVALAKLTSGKYQFIVLDEPTNHLDIQTREVIEAALQEYKGAILVSSHDQYFLEEIGIDKVIDL